MRLTIIPSDKTVYINGVSYQNLNLDFIPANIHAVQWYDTYGEVEFNREVVNNSFIHLPNEIINELGIFQTAVDRWNEAKLAEETLLQRMLEEAQNNPTVSTGTQEF